MYDLTYFTYPIVNSEQISPMLANRDYTRSCLDQDGSLHARSTRRCSVVSVRPYEVNQENYTDQPPHFKNQPEYLIFPRIC